jgi:opacity protein-like surface antigen
MDKKPLLALVCAVAISTPAMAAAPQFKMPSTAYVSLGAGLTSTNDSDFGIAGVSGSIGIDHSANFSGAIGTNVTPNIRTELEISYRDPNLSDIKVNGVGSASLNGDVKTWAYLVNGYYDFMPQSKFSPFLSLGIGAATHKGTISGGGITESGSSTVLAYQAGLGANYALTDKTALWAGYRYLGSEKPDFDGLKATYNANEFRAGVRFNF